jgi:hypothetical protein
MKLTSPERTSDGFKMTFSEPSVIPNIAFDGTNWLATSDVSQSMDVVRAALLKLLLESRDTLFKSSPTQKTLELLLMPWVVIDDKGNYAFKCAMPLPTTVGKGAVELSGILIKRDGILPLWTIKSYTENTPVVDFDWEETPESELREVTLFESEPSDSSNVLKLNTDEEYNTRKFAAKERVKEARLKAILARRAAEVETNRYYTEFNFGDNESTFSEYDISDLSENEAEEEETS